MVWESFDKFSNDKIKCFDLSQVFTKTLKVFFELHIS